MAKTTHFLIQTFRNPQFEMAWAGESSWQPRMDIFQTESEILIHVEAAGVPEDSLKLHLEKGQLVIEGERRRPSLPCPQHCLQVEIAYGTFRRVLELPPDADGNAISAHYDAGILQINVPRRNKSEQNVKVEIR